MANIFKTSMSNLFLCAYYYVNTVEARMSCFSFRCLGNENNNHYRDIKDYCCSTSSHYKNVSGNGRLDFCLNTLVFTLVKQQN